MFKVGQKGAELAISRIFRNITERGGAWQRFNSKNSCKVEMTYTVACRKEVELSRSKSVSEMRQQGAELVQN